MQEKVKQETKEALTVEIAPLMLAKKMPIAEIQEFTGLAKKEIEELASEKVS